MIGEEIKYLTDWLISAISTARSGERYYISNRLNEAIELQLQYDELCRKVEAFTESCECITSEKKAVEMAISNGWLSNMLINFKAAIDKGLTFKGAAVTLSFPGTPIGTCETIVRDDCRIRNRTVAKQFYEYHKAKEGDVMRVMKTGENEFSIEMAACGKGVPPQAYTYAFAKRRPPFWFSNFGISAGDTLVYAEDPSKACVVDDQRHVIYEGKRYSLTGLLQMLRGRKCTDRAVRFFTYNGKLLVDIENARLRNRDD